MATAAQSAARSERLAEPMRATTAQLVIGWVLAAVMTVLVGWLWIVQDDIARQRREAIPTASPTADVPRIPSRTDPVIAASAAKGEQ